MTKKFTKTVSAMAVVFATMISSNVIVSAAEVSNAGSDTVKVIVDILMLTRAQQLVTFLLVTIS